MKKAVLKNFVFAVIAAAVFLSCDMVYITDKANRDISESERDRFEKNERFLKLTNMPLNIQIPNIYSANVANSSSVIGKLNSNNDFFIFRDVSDNSATIYIPLVYNNNSEFIETGFFYTAFSIHVDAITTYIIEISDKFLVHYLDGRGTLDIRTLPEKGSGNDNIIINDADKEELERTGRFLKLTNMPVNTQFANIFSVQISNSVSPIARLDRNKKINIFREEDSSTTVYISLVYNDESEFVENGSFFVSFTIHIDAVTSYIITAADKILIPFINGRGTLDIRTLPASNLNSPEIIGEKDKEELERTGRFLKLTNMPSNTQAANVVSVQIYNSASPIARLDRDSGVRIFIEDDNTKTLYLPLVYNDNSVFNENGFFFVVFTIHIDAVTSYIITAADKILILFTSGRGTLDIRTLPVAGSESHPEIIRGIDRDELERSGRFLKLTNMPLNTQVANIVTVLISNSASPIARLNRDSIISVFIEDDDTNTVYLPLVYNDNSEFVENGSFFVSFTIHIDAVTSYIITAADKILIQFANGRGTLDIRTLPVADSSSPSEFIGESEKDELERTGRYLKLTNMPLHTQAANIVAVQISNSASNIARLNRDGVISVFKENDNTNTIYLPLVYNDNSEFIENGRFFVSFTIHIDAVTSYIITAEDKILIQFINGRGAFNILMMPDKDNSANMRFLEIYNLPPNLLPQNVSRVFIHNQSTSIARCADYSLVNAATSGGRSSVTIPLVYTDNSPFTGTGNFIVSFDLFIDALTHFTVSFSDSVYVSFVDGNGFLDIEAMPKHAVYEITYFTIINLPANVSINNISNVRVFNQVGPVAFCSDYSQINISVNNNKATAKIPLVYQGSARNIFTETGSYFVSFDINIDAHTRILVVRDDSVHVYFIDGNGSIDAANIPVNEIPYLTISSLPLNVSKNHISDINVYNIAGSVASCKNSSEIILFQDSSFITAKIPLTDSSGNYFLDTGSFIITFTINIDALTQITYVKADGLMLEFKKGSAEFDLFSSFGFFNALLVNPSDLEAPRIRRDSRFDINGTIHRVSADVTVNSPLPSSTCVLYLYAYRLGNDVLYEYSSAPPIFISGKNGWYNGVKRALWKMLYVVDNGISFLYKIPVEDNWPHFNTFTTSNGFSAGQQVYSLNGANNPAPASVTLSPGIYLVKLSGAGGGAGYGSIITTPNINQTTQVSSGYGTSNDSDFPFERNATIISGGSSGGRGGYIAEILTIRTETTFTAYTGSGGSNAPAPTFTILRNHQTTFQSLNTYGVTSAGANIPLQTVYIGYIYGSLSGGGGGGGGSGSFLYSSSGYLLCAGGGGGGSGGSFLTPGGAGGAGGSIGSGAGGGAAGQFIQKLITTGSEKSITTSASGGTGGGRNGGAAGINESRRESGGQGSNEIPTPSFSFSGDQAVSYTYFENTAADGTYTNSFTTSGRGGNAAYLANPDFHNTNGANGRGAHARDSNPASNIRLKLPSGSSFSITPVITTPAFVPGASVDGTIGGAGGNNRNSVRGGGGYHGFAITTAHAGSIVIFKLD